jgi:hypothetical protein
MDFIPIHRPHSFIVALLLHRPVPYNKLPFTHTDLPFLAVNDQFRLRENAFSFARDIHSLVFIQLGLR